MHGTPAKRCRASHRGREGNKRKEKTMDKPEKLEDVLIALGVTPNLNGFHTICAALEVIAENSQSKAIDANELYQLVADRTGSTVGSVESSIRHALQRMDTSNEVYNKYIGINIPSNISFLNVLYYKVKDLECIKKFKQSFMRAAEKYAEYVELRIVAASDALSLVSSEKSSMEDGMQLHDEIYALTKLAETVANIEKPP